MSSEIERLSEPDRVSMGDQWFEIASGEHFWIRRRFDVFQKMTREYISPQDQILDIGCGQCLLASMLSGRGYEAVDGADLHIKALQEAYEGVRRKLCYNVHDRHASLEAAYDMVVLFDVIEHIEDDAGFIQSAAWHLKPGGFLVINVPAIEAFRSAYDDHIGHLRRYDHRSLISTVGQVQLNVISWTYWALPLLPMLFLRKLLIRGQDSNRVIRTGFKPPSPLFNALLSGWCQLEWIPNHCLGASLMLIAEKPKY